MTNKFDKSESRQEPGNSPENPAPFRFAFLDMLQIKLPQAMVNELFETVTAARNSSHVVGQQVFARLSYDDRDMENAYANYEA